MLREVLGERRRRRARGRGWSASAGRLGAERREDRVGLRLDQLERLVALARAGEDVGDLGAVVVLVAMARNWVTGTIATSASGPGVGAGVAAGVGSGVAAGSRTAAPSAVAGGRAGRARGRARSGGDPGRRRTRLAEAQHPAAHRQGDRRARAGPGPRAGDAVSSRRIVTEDGRGPARRRRGGQRERPVRAGGRGVGKCEGWRTRPDSNRRSPA